MSWGWDPAAAGGRAGLESCNSDDRCPRQKTGRSCWGSGQQDASDSEDVYKRQVEDMVEEGMVASACSVGYGGIAEALFKMGLGNHIGFKMRADKTTHEMFQPMYGSIVLEMVSDSPAGEILGETTKEYVFEACGEKLDMAQLQEIWEGKLEPVYPYRKAGPTVEKINGKLTAPAAPKIGVAKPKVIIPVFTGTNCEYDTAKAFARAGADPEILVIRNLTPADVAESCKALVKAIDNSQIVMLPGGFSGGDEPDGSAKFIASFFRNPEVTEAVRRLLQQRDGLMLGICNGFQALIKLGLVPYGDIRPITAYDPVSYTHLDVYKRQACALARMLSSPSATTSSVPAAPA